MSLEYSLCPQSTVYVLRVQFKYQEDSLCPQSTVYVQSAVYVLRVQFIEIIAYKATKTRNVCIHGIYV